MPRVQRDKVVAAFLAGANKGEAAAAAGVTVWGLAAWLKRNPDVAALYSPRNRMLPEEREWLEAYLPGRTHREIAEAFNERWPRRPLTARQVGSFIKNSGLATGLTGRFEPGGEAYNKGRAWDEFMPPEAQEASRRAWFKEGGTPHNARPVGTEVWRDGFLWRKVAETRPSRHGWRQVHRILWEERHGPVPDGHSVCFRDGDRANIEIGNLILVPRRLAGTLASLGLLGNGLSEEALLVAELAQAASRAARRVGGCEGAGQAK